MLLQEHLLTDVLTSHLIVINKYYTMNYLLYNGTIEDSEELDSVCLSETPGETFLDSFAFRA